MQQVKFLFEFDNLSILDYADFLGSVEFYAFDGATAAWKRLTMAATLAAEAPKVF